MMKKIFALFLALITLLSLCGTALADGERTSGLYTYEFKGNGTVTITGFDWANNKDNIYIPALIDGYPVTAIGEKAFALPEDSGITGDYVLTLSSGITSIGDFAFQNAPVSTINIPDTATFIGKGAFLMNPNSGFIHFNVAPKHSTFATISGVLFNKLKRELIAFPVTDYAKATSAEDYRLYEVPTGIQSIGAYAFYGRKGGYRNAILLDRTVSDRGNVVLPETVVSIGEYAFANCEKLNVVLSSSIETLGEGAFLHQRSGTNVLEIFDFNNLARLQSIPAYCFSGVQLFGETGDNQYISIPAEASEIQDYAFYQMYNAGWTCEEIRIEGNTARIGKHAFEESTNGIKRVIISGKVKEIDEYAFANNYYLETVTIGGFTETIGSHAFYRSSTLQEVTLSEGLKRIGENAFAECPKLLSVAIPQSVSSIARNAFDRQVTTLTVYQGSYAEQYAIENGLQYKYYQSEDDLSWLLGGTEDSQTEESTDWLNGF